MGVFRFYTLMFQNLDFTPPDSETSRYKIQTPQILRSKIQTLLNFRG